MSDTLLVAIGTVASLIITAVVTAWITIRRYKAESDKQGRNGVLEEWREIAAGLQTRVVSLMEEIKVLRTELTAVYIELSGIRSQIVARETERVEQRGEIRTLEKKVVELKKPDAEAIAQAIAPKLAEAMGTSSLSGAHVAPTPAPVPVRVVPDENAPLPVDVIVKLDTKPKPEKP